METPQHNSDVDQVDQENTRDVAPEQTSEEHAPPADSNVNRLPPRQTSRRRALGGRSDFDLEAMATAGFLVPNDGRSQLAREMRRIKRPLLLNIRKEAVLNPGAASMDTRCANFIMVTSALPGEGKTYTSTNLAISMAAEKDRNVLLVDADIAKRDLSRQFDLINYPGLTQALEGKGAHPDRFVLSTNVERLELLSCGTPTEHIDEMFASDNMLKVMRAMSKFDPSRVVVFDGPPLLVTTEARVLAQYMHQILVVVEAGKTPKDAVQHALHRLSDLPNVAVVLNKSTRPLGSDYGYGYGYGDGYGYGLEEPAGASEAAVLASR